MAYGSLRNETKRNEMVLCEVVLCEIVPCEMVLRKMVLCEINTGNCKIYCKWKVRKQIKNLFNKGVPESLRICHSCFESERLWVCFTWTA